MSDSTPEANMPKRPWTKGPVRGRRKAVQYSDEQLADISPLVENVGLPLCIRPKAQGVDLVSWAASHRELIESRLQEHGAILFRGFGLTTVDDMERCAQSVVPELLEYRERSSPRHAIAERVYTSTDYPPAYPIFLHNENSYQSAWPLKLFFFCQIAAASQGATPLADVRKVCQRIDPAIRERFEQKGWSYVRNFGHGLGLDWKTVFQTEDRGQVEEYCRKARIEVEWLADGDRLRTRAVRRAVAVHPRTRETVWFNHATFFHVSTLEPEIRETLIADLPEDELPANTYYGDGSPIEPETLDALRQAYHAETVRFPWEEGDLLLVDNMLVAHGREPFTGSRKVLVAMAQPLTWDDIDAAAAQP